ncbi:HNH endonuclease signature motif containing protein, partial [Streptacidiphilus jeojiense]|uniref:HNH endonuclease signature motif containing protein n=1 Tax=Streptacidiphilus jeojiense TaxID=436229 RepID=UPI0004BFB510
QPSSLSAHTVGGGEAIQAATGLDWSTGWRQQVAEEGAGVSGRNGGVGGMLTDASGCSVRAGTPVSSRTAVLSDPLRSVPGRPQAMLAALAGQDQEALRATGALALGEQVLALLRLGEMLEAELLRRVAVFDAMDGATVLRSRSTGGFLATHGQLASAPQDQAPAGFQSWVKLSATGTTDRPFWVLSGELEALAGERLRTALEAAAGPPTTEDPRTGAQRLGDALATVAALALNTGTLPVTGGTRPHLTLIADLDTLTTPHPHPTPRRLHHPRTAPGRPGCQRPPSWCEGHHAIHWADGGPTSVDNITLLCPEHHHDLHTTGWNLTRQPNGHYTATPPPNTPTPPNTRIPPPPTRHRHTTAAA